MAIDPVGWVKGTKEYLAEVQSEYKKITWPPQKEAVAGTIGVVAVVAVVTVVLGIVDFALSQLTQLLLK
jgi:preprotein translocase subunit SecE